ncbi:MAG: type III-A CRISPR-associated protein Cas10/Csm1, partial [Anaerolineae bacterium]
MAEIDETTLRAALAGLLHDIGKFAQRAEWLGERAKHTEVGGEVVTHYAPAQWRDFLYPVMGHHDKPLTGRENKVVALADRLSAGERIEEREEQPRQLLSIFCQLQTKIANDKGENKVLRCPSRAYWPLKELALQKKVLFPDTSGQMLDEQVKQAYKDLWGRFLKKMEQLRDAHAADGRLDIYLESVLLLMQQYTWCIPSAYYRAQPDVSLYDHSRTTAALAAVLHTMDEAEVDQLLQSPETNPTRVALLVGGDISGLQDFIYAITSRGAASALRGRSFYLQLLTEVLARYVLRELKLPICNLIYQGGGGFYLLARANDEEALKRIQRQISERLWQHHRGDLYLALAGVPLAVADFYDGRISGKWEELTRTLRQVKQHRFTELEQALTNVFAPQEDGGNEERQCAVCGREHSGTKEDRRSDEEGGVRKCPPCLSYEELGKDLRRAHYLWLRARDGQTPAEDAPPGRWQDVLAVFGFEAGVTESVPRANGRPGVVLALDDTALQRLSPNRDTAVGRRFLVNVTPLVTQNDLNSEKYAKSFEKDQKVGDVKPFSLLEVQSEGIQRLGVLRMDLDDGGKLFSDGFVEYDDQGAVVRRFATLSRVAALSFAISLYFEGWVEFLAQEMNRETREKSGRGDTLYSIYSGGDDLFFVGAWDRVIELARRVRADLTPFAAGHPGIHASAGVVLVGGKYPLYQAAKEAGEAEDHAKRHERRVNGFKERKDAIHF